MRALLVNLCINQHLSILDVFNSFKFSGISSFSMKAALSHCVGALSKSDNVKKFLG